MLLIWRFLEDIAIVFRVLAPYLLFEHAAEHLAAADAFGVVVVFEEGADIAEIVSIFVGVDPVGKFGHVFQEQSVLLLFLLGLVQKLIELASLLLISA